MKAVILAGGLGTRISEETKVKPKPMVEIGGKPILWHIMNRYALFGMKEFIVCSGYKKEKIIEFFEDEKNFPEDWNIKIIDTGLDTMTGGRLKQIKKYCTETFCFTYGDTLNDLDISKLIEFHHKNKKIATVTACQPPGRFGVLEIENEVVTKFMEKPKGDNNWVNGGYFVLEPKIFDYIENDLTIFEETPMKELVQNGQLVAYKHSGFYQPMDTMNDKNRLEKMWINNEALWMKI
ncbi:glucose-1-phosphate cytidylyltransferase [Candidatus Nitrosopumilus koreensis AR1]|uniref:Glucose-1-phosphate cytidylyltransferase n=1 Tax=Candidatus Nitrosopumilus koreensis AR1 TaxID=1229908 RepID=K0B536_9ARCH|nr:MULTISPECIES: glucose-1-phosphate cytidylyltransferase [Nitrosopumilus]AFS80015.1 glucose-1-phosphate cytidylyltransferase [Candidatus Nitrosopumilus koreensis AR1]